MDIKASKIAADTMCDRPDPRIALSAVIARLGRLNNRTAPGCCPWL